MKEKNKGLKQKCISKLLKKYGEEEQIQSYPSEKKEDIGWIIKKLIHERSTKLQEHCEVFNLRFYILTNMFRAPVEALLSLYLVLIWIIFKEGLLHQDPSGTDFLQIIFVPLTLAALVCGFFNLITAGLVKRWVRKMIEKYGKEKLKSFEDMERVYIGIDDSFSKEMIKLHVIGVIFYVLVSAFVAFRFNRWLPMKGNQVICYIIILGFLCGVLWNIQGWLSDRRVDWCKIFNFLKPYSITMSSEICLRKMFFYKVTVWMQFMAGIIFAVFTYHIAANPRENLLEGYERIGDVLPYSTLITFFIAIIALYCRQSYKMFYKNYFKDKEGKRIFPLPEDCKLKKLFK